MKISRNIRPTLLPVARADEVKSGYLRRRFAAYRAALKQQDERPVVRMVRRSK